jgi:hypothetical protein
MDRREGKMKRVFVIGNSHTSAYKVALDRNAALSAGMNIQWFPISSMRMQNLGITTRGGLLKIGGGHRRGLTLDLLNFDAVVICGLGLVIDEQNTERYSQGALACAQNDLIHDSLAMKLLDKLRVISSVPAIILPTPLRAYDEEENFTFDPLYYQTINRLNNDIMHSKNSFILGQPKNTIINGWHTAASLSVNENHKERSAGQIRTFIHMNEKFGEMHWNDVRDLIL